MPHQSRLKYEDCSQYYHQLSLYKLPVGTPYLRDAFGKIKIASGRKPCEQPFQRLMVSYDGRVFMCCIDWGNEHPVGYVADDYFSKGDADYKSVLDRVNMNKKGYELMELTMPMRYTKPKQLVRTLDEIWNSQEINSVRELHVRGKLESIPVCNNAAACILLTFLLYPVLPTLPNTNCLSSQHRKF